MGDFVKNKGLEHKKTNFDINSLPINRKELFKKMIFTRFGKLFQINILCFLFFLPLIIWELLTNIYKSSFTDLSELMSFIISIKSPLIIIFTVIAFIGLAGGIYCVRRLTWSEPVSTLKTFFTGIKQSCKQFIVFGLVAAVFMVLFDMAITMISNTKLQLIYELIFIALLVIAAVLLFSILSYALTLSSLYTMKFSEIVKASIALTVKKIFHNILFICITYLIVLIWFITGIIYMYFIGVILLALFGISYSILVWVLYTNSSYDLYINLKQYPAIYRKGLRPLTKEGATSA